MLVSWHTTLPHPAPSWSYLRSGLIAPGTVKPDPIPFGRRHPIYREDGADRANRLAEAAVGACVRIDETREAPAMDGFDVADPFALGLKRGLIDARGCNDVGRKNRPPPLELKVRMTNALRPFGPFSYDRAQNLDGRKAIPEASSVPEVASSSGRWTCR